ncbi:MAG: PAS domain S-box protein [Spirochaetales bacterium]|nr:PAS domain S-box protein [Spirochaetales bacterium]
MSAIVLLVTSGLSLYFYVENQRNALAGQQLLIARHAANRVENFIHERMSVLETAASLGNMAGGSGRERELVLKKLLGREDAFRELVLFDEMMHEVLRVSRLALFTSGYIPVQSENEFFSRLHNGNTFISPVMIDENTCEPLLIMAIPVTDVFGDVKGALAAEINLKFLWNLVASMKIGEKGCAYVIDRAGNLIAYRDTSRVLGGENLVHLKAVRDFMEYRKPVQTRTVISKGIQNTLVASTYVPLQEPNWAIIIELPFLEAYISIIMAIVMIFLVIVVCFLIAVVAGNLISRKITRPIIDLRDATKSISSGNMNAAIEVTSDFEIGELAESFNRMVENLRKTTVSRDALRHEIKEREKIEATLRKTEEKYRKLFERALDAIIVFDAETGGIIDCNPEATALLEWDRKDLIGKHHDILHTGHLGRGGSDMIFREHEQDNHGKAIMTKVVTKNGRVKDVAVKASFLEIGGKKVVQGIYRDITDLMKSENELKKYIREIEAVNKELDDFTYIVSHDLKEPLWSIDILAMVLENKYKKKLDSEGHEYIDQIRVCSQRLQKLVEDLLRISRLGRKKMPLAEVETEKIIKEAQVRLEHLILKNKARIEIKTTLPVINCDRVRLTEVFVNLVSNAIKFNDKEEPFIEIGCVKKKAVYEFYIKDNGPGIEKRYHEKIFEIFQRFGHNGADEGTGAGLTICKKIIQLHNGRIWVDSEKGSGSSFHFTIPRKAMKAAVKGTVF